MLRKLQNATEKILSAMIKIIMCYSFIWLDSNKL